MTQARYAPSSGIGRSGELPGNELSNPSSDKWPGYVRGEGLDGSERLSIHSDFLGAQQNCQLYRICLGKSQIFSGGSDWKGHQIGGTGRSEGPIRLVGGWVGGWVVLVAVGCSVDVVEGSKRREDEGMDRRGW